MAADPDKQQDPVANLREGYPDDLEADFAWPFDYPYDADPKYPGGELFTEEERAKPIEELAEEVGEP